MLLTEEVEIALSGNNCSYYDKLQYNVPKKIDVKGEIVYDIGKKFKVKAEDLTRGSRVRVLVDCDNCNKEPWEILWSSYVSARKHNGKNYCTSCGKKLGNTGAQMKKNFYDWCKENKREDLLQRWDYEKNKKHPHEVSCVSTKLWYFKCPLSIKHHGSTKKQLNHFTVYTNSEGTCDYCNSFAQHWIDTHGEDALDKFWIYEKNIGIDPWSISKASSTSFYIKCPYKSYHGIHLMSAHSIRMSQKRINCPMCSFRIVHPLDSLASQNNKILEIWSSLNDKTPYEYSTHSDADVYWKCKDNPSHPDYKRTINVSYYLDYRCPKCASDRRESLLQEKVRVYFNNNGYMPKHESYTKIQCVNPKTNYLLPYDNEIEVDGKMLVVEVHGKQHYHQSDGTWFNKDFDLKKRQLYDRYKRMYAKSQGYDYLEIPYWTDNKNEDWKKLIEDKLEEIKERK